jgi:hypothetical protein
MQILSSTPKYHTLEKENHNQTLNNNFYFITKLINI